MARWSTGMRSAGPAEREIARGVLAWAVVVVAIGIARGLAEPGPLALCHPLHEAGRNGRGHTEAVICAKPGSVPEAAAPGALRGPARLLFGLKLDPNRADAASLQILPGIGPSRAAAMLQARERACFESLADLERVPGIGPKTRARVAPSLEIRRPLVRCESGVGCGCGTGP